MAAAVTAMGLPFLLGACNPSRVTPDAAVFQETLAQGPQAVVDHTVGRAFFLGTPLSGPSWRHANAFGAGPVLPAGTPVVVESLESAPAIEMDRWGATDRFVDRRFELGQVYRLRFRTEGGPCASGCETHWRLAGDDAFVERFRQVFREDDPLAALAPEVRALVEGHKVASWFDEDLTLLSLGLPSAAVEVGPDATWVYEHRSCQDGRLQAVPALALWLEASEVTDYERLPATSFYYVVEPVDQVSGLCPVPASGLASGLFSDERPGRGLPRHGLGRFVAEADRGLR